MTVCERMHMETKKIFITALTIVFITANAYAGRWLTRDPIEEHMELDPVEQTRIGGPNLYVLCFNDAVNNIDPFGLKTFKLSFSGAGDVWAGHEQGADRMFSSTGISSGYRAVIEAFDRNKDGIIDEKDCPPFDLRVTGYSWGGWTAIQLAHRLATSDDIRDKKQFTIRLGLLDPVSTARTTRIGYPPDAPRGAAAKRPEDTRPRYADLPSIVTSALDIYQVNGCEDCIGFSGWFIGNPVSGTGVYNLDVSGYKSPQTGKLFDHNSIRIFGPSISRFTFGD